MARGALALLAAILLGAGVEKIMHYGAFVNALRTFQLVPRGVADLVAPPLIGMEILAGLGLLLAWSRRQAAYLTIALLALFSVFIGFDWLVGGREVCEVRFSLTLPYPDLFGLARSLVFLGLSLSVLSDQRRQGPGPPATHEKNSLRYWAHPRESSIVKGSIHSKT